MATKCGQTFTIHGVRVRFPHKPYPSQFSMMDKIIKGIEKSQNCLLESPTGSGKSLALLCSALAWQRAEKEKVLAEEKTNEKSKDCCKCAQAAAYETGSASLSCCTTEAGDKVEVGEGQGHPGSYPDIEDSGFQTGTKTLLTSRGDQGKQAGGCGCCVGKEQKSSRKVPKIWFGTRTHKQIAQITRELAKTDYSTVRMCILSSREHTCIHPHVSKSNRKNEDCKQLLEDSRCTFFDNVRRRVSHAAMQKANMTEAWDLEHFVSFCKGIKACPYFGSRQLTDAADIIFCPYNYLIDPLIRESMEISLKEQVVILDEAHNIEDSAREAASFSASQHEFYEAVCDVNRVMDLQREPVPQYRLVRDTFTSLHELIEQNSRYIQSDNFDQGSKVWNGLELVAQLRNCGINADTLQDLNKAYQKLIADNNDTEGEGNVVKLHSSSIKLIEGLLMVFNFMFSNNMRHMTDYRMAMLKTLVHVKHRTNDVWLNKKQSRRQGGPRTTQWGFALHFWCLNPAVAFSEIGQAVRSIVLTSGTLSPMNTFQSELGVPFPIQLEASHVVGRSQVWVGTISKGPRGCALLGNYHTSETFAYQDDIGELVLGVCQTVPHGVLCFLPSYKSLEKLTARWRMTGLYDRLEEKKVVMSEPKASEKLDFDQLLKNFYDVINECDDCEEGMGKTGALFLAVCRGKVSEGMDFSDNNARAVITVGIPFPNVKDPLVKLKKEYNNQYSQERGLLSGGDWYEIQAYRALNQALGRCIRHRNDWGALILVDERFGKNQQKYTKGLSKWVRQRVQHHRTYVEARQSLQFFTSDRLQNPATNDVSVLNQSTICPSPGSDPATFKTPVGAYFSTPQAVPALPPHASTLMAQATASPCLEKRSNGVHSVTDLSLAGGFLPASQVAPQMGQSQAALQMDQSQPGLQNGVESGPGLDRANQQSTTPPKPEEVRRFQASNGVKSKTLLSHLMPSQGEGRSKHLIKPANPSVNSQNFPPYQARDVTNSSTKLPKIETKTNNPDEEGFIDIVDDDIFDFQPQACSTQLNSGKAVSRRQSRKSRSLEGKAGQLEGLFQSGQAQTAPSGTGISDVQIAQRKIESGSPWLKMREKPVANRRLSLREKLQKFSYVDDGQGETNENHMYSAQVNFSGAKQDESQLEAKAQETQCLFKCSLDLTFNKIVKVEGQAGSKDNDLARSKSPDLFDSDAEQIACDSQLDAVIADVKSEIETKGNLVENETEKEFTDKIVNIVSNFEYNRKQKENGANAESAAVGVKQETDFHSELESYGGELKTRRGKRRKVSGGAEKKNKKAKGVDVLDDVDCDSLKKKAGGVMCAKCEGQLYHGVREVTYPSDAPHFIRDKCRGGKPVLLGHVTGSAPNVEHAKVSLNKELSLSLDMSERDGCAFHYCSCRRCSHVVGLQIKYLEKRHKALETSQVWLFPQSVRVQEDNSSK